MIFKLFLAYIEFLYFVCVRVVEPKGVPKVSNLPS